MKKVGRTTDNEEGRYIREVVYIEENHSDQFLEENVEKADDLDALLKAVATEIKSLKLTKNVSKVKESLKISTGNNESNSFANRIVDSSEHQIKLQENVVALKAQTVVKNETVTTKSIEAGEGKMVTLRPISQLISTMKASTPVDQIIRKIPHPPKEQIPFQHMMAESIPPSKNIFLNLKTQETFNAVVPINTTKFQTKALNTVARLSRNIVPPSQYQMTNSATSSLVVSTKTSHLRSMVGGVEKNPVFQVNQSKFKNISRHSNTKDRQNELPIKRYKQSVDDDCILLPEPATKFNSNANEVQNKLSLVSSPKSNTSSDPLIRKLPSRILVRPNAVPQMPNMQLTTSNTPGQQELKLIKLMLLENPSICKSSASNTVKIIRTNKNQFKIYDDIYYYRTNYQFPQNYFFMNITRQSYETTQRNYGIYWGQPRISCVVSVETRGILDDKTKDFVFIQIKQSLFEQKEQNLKLLNMIQQSMPTPAIPFSGSKRVTIQSIIRKSKTNSLQPSNADPEIINLDDDENEIFPKPKTNSPVNFLPTVKMYSIDSQPLTQNTTRVSSNGIPTNQNVQESSAKDHDMTDVIELQEKGSDEGNYDELAQIYKLLTPMIQKQINGIKYFKMSNRAIYSVTIGPNFSSPVGNENSYNIVFEKNSSVSNIQAVSRHMSVSKLVNKIFDAINKINNLGHGKKHDKLMIVSNEMKNPTFLKAPSVNRCPDGKPIKMTKLADNMIPVREPINLATTTENIKIKSPSTAVKGPINKTLQPKSTVTIPVDTMFKKDPSPKKGNYVVVSTNNRNKAFKYTCDVCAQGFDRPYRLRRHQFVYHNLDGNVIPIDGVSNIVNEPTVEKAKETVVQKHIPTPEQLFTSNVGSKLAIKQEKLDITVPNETIIPFNNSLPDDKNVLIPLNEIPMQEQSDQNYLNDFLSVKVKPEPEVHFEQVVAMSLPQVNYPSLKNTVQKLTKRINPKPNLSLEKNTDSSTDSATEEVPTFEKNERQKRKIKTRRLPKKRVTKVYKTVEKIKRRRETTVKQLMMNLPKCYVKLTDNIKQS